MPSSCMLPKMRRGAGVVTSYSQASKDATVRGLRVAKEGTVGGEM